jgi:hypothetical protein
MAGVGTSKRIAPAAYSALSEALAVIYWNKRPFESFIRNALRDYPELLVRLDFGLYKRETTAQLVDLLAADERRYQELTLGLMLEVSAMESFPNLRSQTDAKQLTAQAVEAVAELREWTKKHQNLVTERAKVEEDRAKAATKEANRRLLAKKLDELKTKFYALHAATNPQQRGRDFESWLKELFMISDLLPRRGFVLQGEQIDGSFTYDTDNYILEARWWKGPVERADLAVFETKVRGKGKNALGLFVSVNGFTSGALGAYNTATPFIVMDGSHLLAVLEQRIPLDDLLDRMKRHMDETGQCYMPIALAVTD